ncbi:MAG: peptide MFS transporter [Marinilabiliaceae bacterium]|nr:peptide MFS transporter [Marinilabiliaceae bacterium]
MIKTPTLSEIQNFKGKYPRQLWSLFFSEMWERFSFYGMRGMLAYFMVQQLLMRDDEAQLQYGATQAFVYAFTFIGGLLADKILGFRKSLVWGALLMILGSIILATNPKAFFFVGIGFTIVGTGFFKPNISTMVGQLYKDNDSRRDAGFSMFYAGINLGAMLGGYLCVWIGKSYSWNLAFGLAAIVMTISLVTFLITKKQLGPIGLMPQRFDESGAPIPMRRWREVSVYLLSLAVIPLIVFMVAHTRYTDWFMYLIGPATLVYLLFEMTRYSAAENKKLAAALVFILSSIVFWAFFEQSGGSLALFAANNLHDTFFGLRLDPNGVNNSSNALFVILFAPLLGLGWLWLAKHRREPNTVVKFGLGFLFLGLSFFILFFTRFFADDAGRTSLEIFTLAYFVMTFAELCLSPIGLSIMTKLSPRPLQGVMMGMWFLATAYGQYVAGILGAGMALVHDDATQPQKLISYTQGYQNLAIYALILGVVLIVASKGIRRLMQEVK